MHGKYGTVLTVANKKTVFSIISIFLMAETIFVSDAKMSELKLFNSDINYFIDSISFHIASDFSFI